MTLAITHDFVSAKGDGLDTTKVQPSNWNEDHVITMAADKVVGRAGTSGAAQELDCTTLAQSLLACESVDDIVALLGLTNFTTGDAKLTMKTSADTGWVMMNDGSIGDASSSATTLAHADAEDLFTLLWTNVIDTWAPVSGGRGSTAAADFAAHKRISLTKQLGRAIMIGGAGSGLTSRVLGQALGEEGTSLTAANVAPHTHGVSGSTGGQSNDHTHNFTAGFATGASPFSGGQAQCANATSTTAGVNQDHTHAFSVTSDTGTGLSGTAHNTMQPSSVWNVMIKL